MRLSNWVWDQGAEGVKAAGCAAGSVIAFHCPGVRSIRCSQAVASAGFWIRIAEDTMGLTFEDFHIGRVFTSKWRTVTRDEISQFAYEYDPQPFHTGHVANANSLFDTVIASGWHSGSVCQRLIVDAFLRESPCLGSPGLDYLRWLTPLLPGDEVRAVSKVLLARQSKSRPGIGIVKFEISLVTREDKVVVEMAANIFFDTTSRVLKH